MFRFEGQCIVSEISGHMRLVILSLMITIAVHVTQVWVLLLLLWAGETLNIKRRCLIITAFKLQLRCPCILSQEEFEPEVAEDRWTFRNAKRQEEVGSRCAAVRPSPKDLIRRFYAILPYFDKDHANTAFLHKYRATVYGMSEGNDMLDKEVAYYAAVVTPLVFMQQYRDIWCLLERFHRAMRFYQISHPTEKRSALKLLQNLRAVNAKIRFFITNLPGAQPPTRTTRQEVDEDDLHLNDKKDIRYLKELIKNLG